MNAIMQVPVSAVVRGTKIIQAYFPFFTEQNSN